MAKDTKIKHGKQGELSGQNRSKYEMLGDEFDKAQSKAMAHLPLIGRPFAELEEKLCNAGIGIRSLFPVECAINDDVMTNLRKQATPPKPESFGPLARADQTIRRS